jgi:hypothetical protein
VTSAEEWAIKLTEFAPYIYIVLSPPEHQRPVFEVRLDAWRSRICPLSDVVSYCWAEHQPDLWYQLRTVLDVWERSYVLSISFFTFIEAALDGWVIQKVEPQ